MQKVIKTLNYNDYYDNTRNNIMRIKAKKWEKLRENDYEGAMVFPETYK